MLQNYNLGTEPSMNILCYLAFIRPGLTEIKDVSFLKVSQQQ